MLSFHYKSSNRFSYNFRSQFFQYENCRKRIFGGLILPIFEHKNVLRYEYRFYVIMKLQLY